MNKLKVPKLRFPGFEGAWETNKLSDWKLKVIDGDRGINYPNGDDFSTEGYCLFMNAKNVTKNGFSFETKTFITKEKDEKLRKGKLKRNDLILTTRGSVGNIAFYDESIKFENLRINSGMVLIRNENSNIDSRFIYSSFFTPKLNRIIDTISFGSAQPQLTVKEINLFKFNIPTLPEQQKIASFLSAVDEKIQQLSRKKELLEQYKKGVMQQLFSGKLRFKDENGKDYPDWEEKKLGDAATITMGQSPDSKSYNTDSQGTLLIQGNADIKERVTSPRQWTNAPTKTCQIGDLILTVRAPVGSVAKSIHYACIGRGVCSIINKKNAVQEFLYQFLIGYETKWGSLEQGSTFTAVSGNEIKGLKINLPSMPEQQKIAIFLSSIDAKIENTKDELEKIQLFKKGLLQKMFV